MRAPLPFPILIGIVLVLSCFGCADEDEAVDCGGRYHLDASVTAREAGAIRAAFDRWNAFAGRPVAHLAAQSSTQESTTCSVRIVEEGMAESTEIAREVGAEFVGAHRHEDGSLVLAPTTMIRVVPGCAADLQACIEGTTMHELGHGLGLGHVAQIPAVMAAAGPLSVEFAADDAAECARAGICQK